MTILSSVHVQRTGPRIGAEITGVDLTAPVDAATADALRQEFAEHKVLVFRGAGLTAAQQVEAVRLFGDPFDHPTAQRDPEHPLAYPYDVRSTGKASTWHVGGLWRTPPFFIESLTFQAVADLGGHTLWADLQAAYDDLSEPFKALLENVSAVYDSDAAHYAQGAHVESVRQTVEHKVVLAHPQTGRRGLFISSSALRLTGLPAGEARAVLPFLLQHASSPDYTIRYSWRPGDFVVWDNVATWHYAIDDYGDAPRRYRKVLATRDHLYT